MPNVRVFFSVFGCEEGLFKVFQVACLSVQQAVQVNMLHEPFVKYGNVLFSMFHDSLPLLFIRLGILLLFLFFCLGFWEHVSVVGTQEVELIEFEEGEGGGEDRMQSVFVAGMVGVSLIALRLMVDSGQVLEVSGVVIARQQEGLE